MKDGKVNPFSLLVCVALNDQSSDIGNFRASLGSHLPIARATALFHSATGLFDNSPDGQSFDRWKAEHAEHLRFEPQPVLLHAGDVALVHPKTAHRRGHNASPDVRYLAIFRVRADAHDVHSVRQISEAFPTDLYPGLTCAR